MLDAAKVRKISEYGNKSRFFAFQSDKKVLSLRCCKKTELRNEIL